MIDRLLAFWRKPLSADSILQHDGDEDSRPLKDIFLARTPAPDQVAMERERDAVLREALMTRLDERERDIIYRRFGLERAPGDLHREHELRETARPWGITRERARQIQREALAKLRHAMIDAGFSSSLTDAIEPDDPLAKTRTAVRELRSKGYSVKAIAARFKLAAADVFYMCSDLDDQIAMKRAARERVAKRHKRDSRQYDCDYCGTRWVAEVGQQHKTCPQCGGDEK